MHDDPSEMILISISAESGHWIFRKLDISLRVCCVYKGNLGGGADSSVASAVFARLNPACCQYFVPMLLRADWFDQVRGTIFAVDSTMHRLDQLLCAKVAAEELFWNFVPRSHRLVLLLQD